MTCEEQKQFSFRARQGTISKKHLLMLIEKQDEDLAGFYNEEEDKD